MTNGRTTVRLDGAPIAGDTPYRFMNDPAALDRVAVEWAEQAPAPALSTIFWLKDNSGEGGRLDPKPWLAERFGVRTLWNAGDGLYVHNDKVGNAAWGYYADNRWGLELSVALYGARRQSKGEAGRPEDTLDQAFIRRGFAIP